MENVFVIKRRLFTGRKTVSYVFGEDRNSLLLEGIRAAAPCSLREMGIGLDRALQHCAGLHPIILVRYASIFREDACAALVMNGYISQARADMRAMQYHVFFAARHEAMGVGKAFVAMHFSRACEQHRLAEHAESYSFSAHEGERLAELVISTDRIKSGSTDN